MKLNLEKKKIAFFVSKNREEIANFRISQGAYKDSIDLLSDKMVGNVSVVLTNNKTIVSSDMYSKIKECYKKLIIGGNSV